MHIATFYLPPSDSLTKWIGGYYFSFRPTLRGEITCRGDTLSHKFSNIRPQAAQCSYIHISIIDVYPNIEFGYLRLLITYSAFMNPIENCFSVFKNYFN